MKKFLNIIFYTSIIIFFGCEESNDPIVGEDHFLNYEVESVPVTQDYDLGAFYFSGNFDPDFVEEPTLGRYNPADGDPGIYNSHIEMAKQAGIDFFIHSMRTSAFGSTGYQIDSTIVANLMQAPNASDVDFALSYNFAFMQLGNNNRVDDPSFDKVPLVLNDFENMKHFFNMPNYKRVNGKALVYINNGAFLFANDNKAVYDAIRSAMNADGIELYIIGEQPEWTPPLRYDFRFVGGVDAVSHNSYITVTRNSIDRLLLFEQYVDQALTIAKNDLEQIGLEYIPQVSPSYNVTYVNPNNGNFIVEKDEESFRTFCDIAQKASSENRIILVNSFNNWNFDTQVEPAQSYGSKYLDILRDEFKVN
ncbi:glycoside hydrolase family 99-like domain-containing protein [Jejuia pallidilutea]|uniref:Glycosyltransferase WbsX n=1 Tax=Jejuia pallidilutea TaxID=504487 RepID=A0A090VUJ9_9FLAO|nr:glycoside hydrolase family 99-like domain-containing protein [Jejuia pallidilutea]GAL68391.1 hypothetical protein JCM19301_1998 [Jejuia pallidilutea]GAL72351.1 hypothetical protein JCM19302_3629 [Jejuia pallidilutea]GAL89495.1 hypothetical protein JCM19538_1732 [Jejuia pallidilutea]